MENTPLLTSVLSINGQRFNADELTALVGIKPTKIWQQKLESLNLANPEMPTMSWVYEIRDQEKWSFGEAMSELLNLFWCKREEINAFVKRNRLEVHIRCIPRGDASVMQYFVSSEIIKKMAYLDASFSLAAYKEELISRIEEAENGGREN